MIATYHTAGVTVDARGAMAEWNAERLVDIFAGKSPPAGKPRGMGEIRSAV